MRSFRTELEDTVVQKDILDLEKKIFEFKNLQIDEEKFRSLRLARGVYGQRQEGVQMIRIKLPMGQFTAQQLRRIAEVSDEYASGNLHITTRQDIQLHYVLLDRTPKLWAELEKDKITLREACGNTVRNITTSIMAGIDVEEPFDVTPYANAYFNYFLRNPICQEMGRKIKISFSSSEKDNAISFIHDLGFIPKIKNGEKGFKVLVGGGIGSQPMLASEVFSFLPTDKIIPFGEAVLRVFDRHGERNNRNKARLKFLIKKIGIDAFLQLVEDELKAINSTYFIEENTRILKEPTFSSSQQLDSQDVTFLLWKKNNVFPQKQKGYFAAGIPIKTGDILSKKARKLALIIEQFTRDDNRLSIGQSVLLRDIKEEHLPPLYYALKKINLHQIGFHKINDIVACPGTDTCNLGIASSIGLANELKKMLEEEYSFIIEKYDLSIKISGCMNACGQHTMANIGFQGMTLKQGQLIAPATQLLLGGGVLGNGTGRFADKILKVPARRTPDLLRSILNDYIENKNENEEFNAYYDRKTKDYFYQNLKHFSDSSNLESIDFVDWGNEEKYKKAIGVGECAGVTIDLIQTLLFEADESLDWAIDSLTDSRFSDAVVHAYNAQIKGAKALLTFVEKKTNSQVTIIDSLDEHFPSFEESFGYTFKKGIALFKENKATESFAISFLNKTKTVIDWIIKTKDEGTN